MYLNFPGVKYASSTSPTYKSFIGHSMKSRCPCLLIWLLFHTWNNNSWHLMPCHTFLWSINNSSYMTICKMLMVSLVLLMWYLCICGIPSTQWAETWKFGKKWFWLCCNLMDVYESTRNFWFNKKKIMILSLTDAEIRAPEHWINTTFLIVNIQ